MFKSHVTFTIIFLLHIFSYAVKIPENIIVEHEGFKKIFFNGIIKLVLTEIEQA